MGGSKHCLALQTIHITTTLITEVHDLASRGLSPLADFGPLRQVEGNHERAKSVDFMAGPLLFITTVSMSNMPPPLIK